MRHRCPPHLLVDTVLGTALIQAAGTADDKVRLLPGLADGSSIAAVAATDRKGHGPLNALR